MHMVVCIPSRRMNISEDPKGGAVLGGQERKSLCGDRIWQVPRSVLSYQRTSCPHSRSLITHICNDDEVYREGTGWLRKVERSWRIYLPDCHIVAFRYGLLSIRKHRAITHRIRMLSLSGNLCKTCQLIFGKRWCIDIDVLRRKRNG